MYQTRFGSHTYENSVFNHHGTATENKKYTRPDGMHSENDFRSPRCVDRIPQAAEAPLKRYKYTAVVFRRPPTNSDVYSL